MIVRSWKQRFAQYGTGTGTVLTFVRKGFENILSKGKLSLKFYVIHILLLDHK